MAAPTERDQRLYDALAALRAAPSASAASLDRHWRVVYSWLETTFPPRRQDDSEITQRTVLRVMHAIGQLDTKSPRAAAHWLGTIRRRIAIDASRSRVRARERQVGIGTLPGEADLVDAGPLPDEGGGRAGAELALAGVEDELRDRIGDVIDARTTDPRKRVGDRLRADAAIARAVHRKNEAEIRTALAGSAPASRDALYKWVERGRELVLAALDAWISDAGGEPGELEVLGAYREIVGERRSDKGVARPARRGPRQSGRRRDVSSAESVATLPIPSRPRGRS